MIDPYLVKKIADITGFRSDIVEQVLNLKSVLRRIYSDPNLENNYALIGGTAINFFDPELPRLSVDIDLDYIHTGREEFKDEVIKQHLKIFTKIGESIEMELFKSKLYPLKLNLIFLFKSNYSPSNEGYIKIDISYITKTPIYPPNGEKRLNHSHMKTAFILKGITRVKDLFYQRGQNIKSCSKNEFKIQLFPFLRSYNISENEIELMKRQSREFLDRVCSNNWTKKEKEFVHKFQDKGQYCPEILFGKNNSEFKHMYSNQYLSDSAASFHKK